MGVCSAQKGVGGKGGRQGSDPKCNTNPGAGGYLVGREDFTLATPVTVCPIVTFSLILQPNIPRNPTAQQVQSDVGVHAREAEERDQRSAQALDNFPLCILSVARTVTLHLTPHPSPTDHNWGLQSRKSSTGGANTTTHRRRTR